MENLEDGAKESPPRTQHKMLTRRRSRCRWRRVYAQVDVLGRMSVGMYILFPYHSTQ